MFKRLLKSGKKNNPSDLLDRLQLIRSENIGPQRFAALLAHFGTAEAALDAAQKGEIPFVSANSKKPIRLCPRVNAEQELIYADKIGVRFISFDEEIYPPYLREIGNPPPLLVVKGNAEILRRPCFSIVGSRNASAIGSRLSYQFARELGEAGFVIVSGFARGIDSFAHNAALKTGTIAAVAGGVDYIYPPENEKLYQEILANGGAFISEMPLGWKPRAVDFPRRNRLIAGLSLGLLVVEASERSGSLISARHAAEGGRIVFAVPGSPLDPRAKGANGLIKDGACLADSSKDILDTLSPLFTKEQKNLSAFPPPRDTELSNIADRESEQNNENPVSPPPPSATGNHGSHNTPAPAEACGSDELTEREKRLLLQSLSLAPIAIDSLAQITNIPLSRLYLGLMDLELAGSLLRHDGGLVSAAPA